MRSRRRVGGKESCSRKAFREHDWDGLQGASRGADAAQRRGIMFRTAFLEHGRDCLCGVLVGRLGALLRASWAVSEPSCGKPPWALFGLAWAPRWAFLGERAGRPRRARVHLNRAAEGEEARAGRKRGEGTQSERGCGGGSRGSFQDLTGRAVHASQYRRALGRYSRPCEYCGSGALSPAAQARIWAPRSAARLLAFVGAGGRRDGVSL